MILLTGATGFLGKHLLNRLRTGGAAVCPTTNCRIALASESGFQYLDMEDAASFSSLPDKIDTMIHLAALIPQKNKTFPFEKFMATNASNVGRLVEALAQRGCRKFIYASTQMVIERPVYEPVDENHPMVPISDYGFSKAAGEKFFFALAAAYGGQALSLRFPGIYGLGQRPGYVLSHFIEAVRQGKPLNVAGAKIEKNLLYVSDAINALLLAIQAETSGIFNIGTNRPVTIQMMAEAVADVFGNKTSTILYSGIDEPAARSDLRFDLKKAENELGFLAQFSLREGLMDYKLALEAAL